MTQIIEGDADSFYSPDSLIIDMNISAAALFLGGFWNTGFGSNDSGVGGDSRRENQCREFPKTKNWVSGTLTTTVSDNNTPWNNIKQLVAGDPAQSPSGDGGYTGELYVEMDNLLYYSQNGLFAACKLASYLDTLDPTDLQGNNTLTTTGGASLSTETFYPEDIEQSIELDGTGTIDIETLSFSFTSANWTLLETLFRPTDLTILPMTVMEDYQDDENYAKIVVDTGGAIRLVVRDGDVERINYDTGETAELGAWNYIWLNKNQNQWNIKANYQARAVAGIYSLTSTLDTFIMGANESAADYFIGQLQSLRGLDTSVSSEIYGTNEIPTAPPGERFTSYFFTFNKPAPRVFGLKFRWTYTHSASSTYDDEGTTKVIDTEINAYAITESVEDIDTLDQSTFNTLDKTGATQNPIYKAIQTQVNGTIPDSQSIVGIMHDDMGSCYIPFSFPENTKVFGIKIEISNIATGNISEFQIEFDKVELTQIKGTNFNG